MSSRINLAQTLRSKEANLTNNIGPEKPDMYYPELSTTAYFLISIIHTRPIFREGYNQP